MITMNPEKLTYVKERRNWTDEQLDAVADAVDREIRSNEAEYARFEANRQNVDVNPTNVRLAMVTTVVSIKTETEIMDGRTSMAHSGNFRDLKEYVEKSSDGNLKWDKVHKWYSSDLPDRVSNLLNDGRIMDAHALLAGRDPDTGGPVESRFNYLRTVKASLVLFHLGFNRVCLDSRRWKSMRPAIQAIIRDTGIKHPDTEDPDVGRPGGYGSDEPRAPNPYRKRSPRTNADESPTCVHETWEDKFAKNPPEYHAVMDMILGEIAERAGHSKGEVNHALFNLAGERTFHEPLMERLSG